MNRSASHIEFMNYLLIFSAIFLGWTALHIVAAERERRVQEMQSRRAADAARRKHDRQAAEAPVVVS